jgi:large conductance mechanosensitive channel
MSFWQEFKKFISRGNAIDMAVGIIIGAAFSKVIDVFVNHILMPPIGLLIDGANFASMKITLVAATATTPAVSIDYGMFINSIINFLIVGVSVFSLIKIANRLHLKKSLFAKLPCPECRMEIPEEAKRCGYCTVIVSRD